MTDLEQQRNRATIFRALHSGPEILLLPNVWDVASARLIEDSGYKAIATTSAGIAFSLGYPDGQKISREEMWLLKNPIFFEIAKIWGIENVQKN
jgi:2-methylisocitrate lyase-like PEP mutase family enzyme